MKKVSQSREVTHFTLLECCVNGELRPTSGHDSEEMLYSILSDQFCDVAASLGYVIRSADLLGWQRIMRLYCLNKTLILNGRF